MKTACPTCTTSAKTNIANHLKCIEVAALGPADPREPSTEFWADKAKKWNVEPLRKERARSRMGLSSLTPGMVAFALGEDNRPRNNNGQFVANETGGADPNSMQAAYGGVEQEKAARRQGLMARLKAMMGGK